MDQPRVECQHARLRAATAPPARHAPQLYLRVRHAHRLKRRVYPRAHALYLLRAQRAQPFFKHPCARFGVVRIPKRHAHRAVCKLRAVFCPRAVYDGIALSQYAHGAPFCEVARPLHTLARRGAVMHDILRVRPQHRLYRRHRHEPRRGHVYAPVALHAQVDVFHALSLKRVFYPLAVYGYGFLHGLPQFCRVENRVGVCPPTRFGLPVFRLFFCLSPARRSAC